MESTARRSAITLIASRRWELPDVGVSGGGIPSNPGSTAADVGEALHAFPRR